MHAQIINLHTKNRIYGNLRYTTIPCAATATANYFYTVTRDGRRVATPSSTIKKHEMHLYKTAHTIEKKVIAACCQKELDITCKSNTCMLSGKEL